MKSFFCLYIHIHSFHHCKNEEKDPQTLNRSFVSRSLPHESTIWIRFQPWQLYNITRIRRVYALFPRTLILCTLEWCEVDKKDRRWLWFEVLSVPISPLMLNVTAELPPLWQEVPFVITDVVKKKKIRTETLCMFNRVFAVMLWLQEHIWWAELS